MAQEPWLIVVIASAATALVTAVIGHLRYKRASHTPAPAPKPSPNASPSSSGRPVVAKAPAPAAPVHAPHVVILGSDAHAEPLKAAISIQSDRAGSVEELVAATRRRRPSAVFADVESVKQLEGRLSDIPVIAIVDAPAVELLPTIVRQLDENPTLSNIVTSSLATAPQGRTYLTNLLQRLGNGPEHDVLGSASVGRIALLAQASRREARFGRMHDYFSKQGLSDRTISTIHDIAEELVMNALYNAPTEAGYFKQPVSRTEDVTMPLDRACEISYGMEGDEAFVRVRDTFGSLTRQRLLEVLNRCMASKEVALDESRGGAGLGLWRIFSSASTISIAVAPGRLTDIFVRIGTKGGKAAKLLRAVHLSFFPRPPAPVDDSVSALDYDSGLVDRSIALVQPAGAKNPVN